MTEKQFFSRTHDSKDYWETPPYFFKKLDDIFHFTLDACATPENAKCQIFFTENDDGLSKEWKNHIVFINPPFSDTTAWVKKAFEQSHKYKITIVMIVPSRTDTECWHDYIMKADEIWFVRGRVNFLLGGKQPKNGSTFPLCVVVFNSLTTSLIVKSFERGKPEKYPKIK